MESLAVPPSGIAPPISKASPQAREPRPLIGDFIRRPAWLWLTHVAPLALLLASASHTYAIIASDMSATQRQASLALGIALVTIATGVGVMAIRTQRARQLLSNRQCALLLTLSLVVMTGLVAFCWTVIPDMEMEWLSNRWELLNEAFCLGMPGAFYAILILASRPLRRHGGAEFGVIVFLTALGGVFFYGLTMGLERIMRPSILPEWAGITFMMISVAASGTLVTAAITRSTLVAYTAIRRSHPILQRCFMFIVACAGPIGGLYLNKTIPFPVDFQAPVIYILAFLNGSLLLLPTVRSIFWHRAIWLAQCVLFPFSAYFFIVFLPWLPLSLFAMIACGAGFLMLVPLVLGISHACRIADGFREEIRDGRAWPVAAMGLTAILILPALGAADMWRDREALDEALTYIYSPDYRNDVTFPGSLPALASSLQHLRDAKQGIFLPFLTPLYNQIVFHGLVLPDAKIKELQAAFFGDASTAKAGYLMRSPLSDDNGWWGGTIRPDNNVSLEEVKATEQATGATSTAQLLLTMRGGHGGFDSVGSEFSTSVHLPEGVYITGFSLKIGNEFVPARIVEKKTALWVYEKITQVHCDPGIVTFNSRTDLTLKVAPFSENEVRQARLDLVYANGTPVTITIGDKDVQLGAKSSPTAPLAVTTCVTSAGSIALADLANTANWQLKRTPYLDILIDCSRGANYSAASLAHAISQARAAFPDAKLARVTAINFEAQDIVTNPIPIGQLDTAVIAHDLLPSRGGLLQDRFLKRDLLLAHDRMQTSADQARMRPQFILISSLGQGGRREDRLADFLRLVPDARVILTEDSDGQLSGEDLVSRDPATVANIPPVTLWRWDNHYTVSAADAHTTLTFPGDLPANGLQIYNPQLGQFAAMPTGPAIPPNSRFADGVRTWAAQDEAELNPHLLKDDAATLIGLSKHTGILVPDSSYIAVESMAEWRAMEEKEKQKLKNNQVFEFEEPVAPPEPATWVLLALGLLVLALKRRRRA